VHDLSKSSAMVAPIRSRRAFLFVFGFREFSNFLLRDTFRGLQYSTAGSRYAYRILISHSPPKYFGQERGEYSIRLAVYPQPSHPHFFFHRKHPNFALRLHAAHHNSFKPTASIQVSEVNQYPFYESPGKMCFLGFEQEFYANAHSEMHRTSILDPTA
jgi:hypothetical protein